MTEQTKPETYLQRFRRKSPRIDYYPGPDAMEAIKRMRQHSPGSDTQAILDKLVRTGFEHLAQSGKVVSGK